MPEKTTRSSSPSCRIRVRRDREAEPVIRAVADGHGRGRRTQSSAVDRQPHRRCDGGAEPARRGAARSTFPCRSPTCAAPKPAASSPTPAASKKAVASAGGIGRGIRIIRRRMPRQPDVHVARRAGHRPAPALPMGPAGSRSRARCCSTSRAARSPSVAACRSSAVADGSHSAIATRPPPHRGHLLRRLCRQGARIVALGHAAGASAPRPPCRSCSSIASGSGRSISAPGATGLPPDVRVDQQQDRTASRSHRYGELVGIGLRVMPSQA